MDNQPNASRRWAARRERDISSLRPSDPIMLRPRMSQGSLDSLPGVPGLLSLVDGSYSLLQWQAARARSSAGEAWNRRHRGGDRPSWD